MDRFDLVVIGSGPAGQRAAIQAAKSGSRVALIERREVVGGTCINTGTIPSKTMREAVLHLSGFLFQGIDNWAHLGGLAGGYACSKFLDPLHPERLDHFLIALGLLFLSAIAIVVSVIHGLLIFRQ